MSLWRRLFGKRQNPSPEIDWNARRAQVEADHIFYCARCGERRAKAGQAKCHVCAEKELQEMRQQYAKRMQEALRTGYSLPTSDQGPDFKFCPWCGAKGPLSDETCPKCGQQAATTPAVKPDSPPSEAPVKANAQPPAGCLSDPFTLQFEESLDDKANARWWDQHRDVILKVDHLRLGTAAEKELGTQIAEGLIKEFPDVPFPYTRYAQLLAECGRFPEAKNALQEALKKCTTRRKIYPVLMDLAVKEGDLLSALRWSIQSFVAADMASEIPPDSTILYLKMLASLTGIEDFARIALSTVFTTEHQVKIRALWQKCSPESKAAIKPCLERFRASFLLTNPDSAARKLQFVPCTLCGARNLYPKALLQTFATLPCRKCEREFENPAKVNAAVGPVGKAQDRPADTET